MKELKDILPQRMYCLTLCNISTIQQAIQPLHAVVEYGLKYFDNEEYQRWAQIDKTVIILNGGTSTSLFLEHLAYLIELDMKYAIFNEPDLFGGMTAICFLADERVWDRKKYPDALEIAKINGIPNGGTIINAIYHPFDQAAYIESIGGEYNLKVKEYLSKLRLV